MTKRLGSDMQPRQGEHDNCRSSIAHGLVSSSHPSTRKTSSQKDLQKIQADGLSDAESRRMTAKVGWPWALQRHLSFSKPLKALDVPDTGSMLL